MSSATDRPTPGPVALPKGYTGIRSWRRERMKKQKRQRRLAAAGLFVLVVVAAVLVGMVEPVGNRATKTTSAVNLIPTHGPLPSLFVVTADGCGTGCTAQDIDLLLPLPSGKGGTVLAIPPSTFATLVPGGPSAIDEALVSTPNAPGDEEMLATVENLLGFSVSSVAVATDDQLASLLGPAGPLHVDLPTAIAPAEGSQGESFPAGLVSVQPGQVGDFLSDEGAEGATEQATRSGNLVQAWAEAVRTDPRAAPSADPANPPTSTSPTSTSPSSTSATSAPGSTTTTTQAPIAGIGSFGQALTQLSRGAVVVVLLPVDEIPAESSGAPVEYQVDTKQYLAMVPGLVPGQPGALETRPKVDLLNGTGGLGLDQEAMFKLEPWVNITLSGNACSPQGSTGNIPCFGYPSTEIVTYDARGRAAAPQVARLLGGAKVVSSPGSSDIVDMAVIVGADFNAGG